MECDRSVAAIRQQVGEHRQSPAGARVLREAWKGRGDIRPRTFHQGGVSDPHLLHLDADRIAVDRNARDTDVTQRPPGHQHGAGNRSAGRGSVDDAERRRRAQLVTRRSATSEKSPVLRSYALALSM